MELILRKKASPTTDWLTIKAFTYSDQDMGDTVISADVVIPMRVETISEGGVETNDWIGAFVTYEGEYFSIVDPPTRTKDLSKREYTYSIKLEPHKRKLKSWYFADYVTSGSDSTYTGLANTHFFGNITEFAGRLLANLNNREYGQWTVTVVNGTDTTEYVEFAFDKTYIWDALADMHSKLKIPYRISGRSIWLGNIGQEITGHNFAYGMNNGLYSLTRSIVNEAVYNRIIPVGSDRNLPLNYYRSIAPIALHTPYLMPKVFKSSVGTKYWYDRDASVGVSEPVSEIFVQYEDIYPSIKGSTFNGVNIDEIKAVGSIGSDTITEDGKVVDSSFNLTLNPLGFNLMSHLSSKEEMYVEMTSGACAGCRFKILSVDGKSLNKYDYTNNLIIKPKTITENDVTTGEGLTYEEIIAVYDNLIQSDVTIAQVKFAPEDIIRNYERENQTLTFTMATYFRKRNSEESYLLEQHQAILPYDTYLDFITAVGTDIFIPRTTLPGLSAGIWELVSVFSYQLSGETAANIQFGRSRISALFSPSEPTIINEFTLGEDEPEVPSTDDVVIKVQKDLQTFGVLMPNAAQMPVAGDKLVLIGIELPEYYILAAEQKVEDRALDDLMNKFSIQKFNYNMTIDEQYVEMNKSDIYPKLRCGNTMYVDNISESLRITQASISYKENKIFPDYSITLSNTTKPITGLISNIERAVNSIASRTNAMSNSTAILARVINSNISRVEAIAQNATSSLPMETDTSSLYVKKSGDTVTGTLNVKKLVPETLIIPKTAPVLEAGQWALFMSDTGFTGEEPGSGGNVDTLGDIGDVFLTDVAPHQFIRRALDNSGWENVTLVKSMISDFAHNHDSDYLKLSGGTLTGALAATEFTEGGTLLSNKYLYPSKALFSPSLGVLIQTNIIATEDAAVEIVIRGSRWDSTNLLNLDINLYHTSSNISGLRAIGHGTIGTVYAFDYLGVLCIWFAATPSYSNVRAQVFASGTNRQDRVISITNSSLPSSGRSKDQSIAPSLIYTSLNSNKSDVSWAASSFIEGGTALSSKYLGINANAVSATKLLNTRTIWGQNFDGTANVTGALTSVTDITASGTISMAENVNTRLTIPTSPPANMTPGRWYFWIG